MWDSISSLFGKGGMLQTGTEGYAPGTQQQINGGMDPKFAEKGSILGMTPSGFASIAGQIGSAISPKDSWQSKLGGVAAQFGSQKLAQLAQAEKEKRMTELLKQVLGQATSKQVTQTAGPEGLSVGGVSTGIPKQMSEMERMPAMGG